MNRFRIVKDKNHDFLRELFLFLAAQLSSKLNHLYDNFSDFLHIFLLCLQVSRGHFKHECRYIQVNQLQYHSDGKANLMSPSPPDTSQRPKGISSPNSPHRPPPSPHRPPSPACHPAGRRLMTLCLPSNRLFDNKLAFPFLHVSTAEDVEDAPRCSNRKRGMWRHTHGSVREQAGQPGEWEPLIFIHDREKVLVCWHRLLHLHSVIDCLPQRGSFVYLQIDEPVLLTPFSCHAVMLPPKKTLQSSP